MKVLLKVLELGTACAVVAVTIIGVKLAVNAREEWRRMFNR